MTAEPARDPKVDWVAIAAWVSDQPEQPRTETYQYQPPRCPTCRRAFAATPTQPALPAPDALRAKLIDLAAPLYTSRKRAVEGVARWLNLEAAALAALREEETK